MQQCRTNVTNIISSQSSRRRDLAGTLEGFIEELIEPDYSVDHTSITVRLHTSTAPLLRALSAIAGITALILRALLRRECMHACMPARSNPENAITIK
jgi:hypothetical protein